MTPPSSPARRTANPILPGPAVAAPGGPGTPTLIIGDFYSRCGVCGDGADPTEREHRTVLGGSPAGMTGPGVGCGVTWTHVTAAADSLAGAERRIRKARPDLTLLPERRS